MELALTEALEQARLVRSGEVSPVELVEMYLRRIEDLDPELNSFVTVAADSALEDARRAGSAVSAGGELPPFHGVPISVKDLAETAGIRTTFSCRALEHFVPEEDDNVVTKIREAGFVIIGKSNTSEFGTVPFTESELNGACRNPWDTSKTPGGSSGGAASGVAAGLVPVAHAADGGGSIRVPASCCGLFGIKPSRGRISAGPRAAEHWHGFSTSGPITRTVRDGAALLDAMAGYFPGDPYTAPPPVRPFVEEAGRDPGRLKVAFTTTSPNQVDVAPEMRTAAEGAAALLERLGHDVVEEAPPWIDDTIQPAFVRLISTGMSLIDFLPHDHLEPLNRFLVESAAGITSIEHMQALLQANQYVRSVIRFWGDHDVLLTPTQGMAPPDIGWIFSDDDPMMALVRSGWFIPFTPFANMTGQPAVSVPLHESPEGVPVGVQLIGRPFDEATLIRLSAQLEEAKPWRDRSPSLLSAPGSSQ